MLIICHHFLEGDIVKILIPLFALVQLSSASASLIGIMDSGTDISHRDLAPKAWVNKKERAGSKIDLDKDGLPGDINGWDFTENSAKVFNNRYNHLINEDVKSFYNYYSKYELGTVSSQEVAWLKLHTQDRNLMNKVNFIGAYIHGTHVAGISAVNNSKAKILSMKIIPTVFGELKSNKSNFEKSMAKALNEDAPTKTIEEYTAEVVNSANQQVSEMIELHTYVNFHKLDVVNQSFGIGYGDAKNFIKSGFVDGLKREPTEAELTTLADAFFKQIITDGPKMFAAAPNTLFTIAAGNDSSNNDLHPDFPAGIPAENKIVVAATLGYKSLANFSNYGATTVDVAAPGVAITSTAPTNTHIALSGTSQATPYVTNIIAAMKDINSSLTTNELKSIVLETVDVKSWLKGKVKTSGIVNRARALRAAEYAKTLNLDVAISKARAIIADVAIEKSFQTKRLGFSLDFKPIRPSLIIPQI